MRTSYYSNGWRGLAVMHLCFNDGMCNDVPLIGGLASSLGSDSVCGSSKMSPASPWLRWTLTVRNTQHNALAKH
eukprot:1875946-Pyramimonas_sp.AAC.1